MLGRFVDWSTEIMSVGIAELDEQHKALVEMLNDLHHAVHMHEGREQCGEILNRLIDYTRIHFATEESVMSTVGYPAPAFHRNEHEALLEQVRKYKTRFDAGAALTFEVLHFLKNWLIQHIVGSDKEYGRYIVEHGTIRRPWYKRLRIGR